MNSDLIGVLMLSAYDPSNSSVLLNGERVYGASAERLYRRVSSTEHELHLQATSGTLQKLHVGYAADLKIQVHGGSDRHVDVNVGQVVVNDIYVEELGCEVPVIVVVLKKQK